MSRVFALLALFVVGCSGEPMVLDAGREPACTPGESRACACSSGAMGAQLCAEDGSGLGPCSCDELEVDGGQRADEDAGGGLEVDAGLVDAGVTRDAGEPDGGPTDGGSKCTVLPQSGCAEGEACRMMDWIEVEPGAWGWRVVPPFCAPAGTMGEHERGRCRASPDNIGGDFCEAELFCDPARGCLRYCEPSGEPCPDFYSYELGMSQEQRCVSTIGPIPFCSTIWH